MTTPTETALGNRRDNISYGDGPVTIIGIATDVPETIIIQPDDDLAQPSMVITTQIVNGQLTYQIGNPAVRTIHPDPGPEYIDQYGVTTDAEGNELPGPPLGKAAPWPDAEHISAQIATRNAQLKGMRRAIKQLHKGNKMLNNQLETAPITHQNRSEWKLFRLANSLLIDKLTKQTRATQADIRSLASNRNYQQQLQEDKALKQLNDVAHRLRKLGKQVQYRVEDESTVTDTSLPF